MATLTKRNRTKLKQAKRAGDTDALELAIEEVVENQLGIWKRSKFGQYGLVEDCDSREGRRRGNEIVRLAWQKLKEIAPDEVRQTVEEYEDAYGGSPEYDAGGDTVDSDVGGSTLTTWEKIPRGYRQTESGRIYIGQKWICKLRRGGHKHVIIAVMHTIIHELMGHWDKVGQKVPGSNEAQRKASAEDKADKTDERHWADLKDTERWDACVAELEEECEERQPAVEAEIREAIDTYLESLCD